MNTRKWLTVSGIVVLTVLATLALAVGLTQAQEPEIGEEEGNGLASPQAEAAVYNAITFQGRLTDSGGNPINGSRAITLALYTASSGGTRLCYDQDNVSVDNGLFNFTFDGSNRCTSYDISGRALYLGVQVEGDDEMSREAIRPVPYAYSLRPGAVISDTSDGILTVRSTNSGDGDAILASAWGAGEGVEAYSVDGIGVAAFSDTFIGLQAYSNDPANDHPGVFGCAAVSNSTCDPYRDDNGAGVMGYSQSDFGGYFVGGTTSDGGVHAEANYILGMGVWAENNGGGAAVYAEGDAAGGTSHVYPTLYLVQQDAAGDFVVGANSWLGTRYWRVDRTGKGFFNGGTQASGADFAEQMAVEGEEAAYEPGDVLVISASADRMVELSAESFATAVIGVYSTKPAVLAGAPDTDDPLAGIPVAITGIVSCKVSAENGLIQRGDLLVTAATPGHAMRAGDNPPQGTVLGKALGELETGTGVIQVLVTLQ